MNRLLKRRFPVLTLPVWSGGEASTYIDKVVGYGPVAYWPLNEAAGASAAVCQINTAQNGTPTNVTFGNALGPDGVNNAPLFTPASNSVINIATATFNAQFPAVGREGSISMWLKVVNAAFWEILSPKTALDLRVNSDNYIIIRKSATANTLTYTSRIAGGTVSTYDLGSQSTTDWFHVGMRISDSGNTQEYFLNGVEIADSQDSMTNTWSGGLASAVIGFGSGAGWGGWIAHVAVFNSVVSDPVMLGLGTATP